MDERQAEVGSGDQADKIIITDRERGLRKRGVMELHICLTQVQQLSTFCHICFTYPFVVVCLFVG